MTQNFVDSANLSTVLSFLESKEEDIVGVDNQVSIGGGEMEKGN